MTVVGDETPVIRRGIFPAVAKFPDGTERRVVKVFVTTRAVYVYITGDDGDPELIYEAPYSAAQLPPAYSPRTDLFRLTTPDGELVVTRLAGCGCHLRRLKTFTPWTPERVGR